MRLETAWCSITVSVWPTLPDSPSPSLMHRGGAHMHFQLHPAGKAASDWSRAACLFHLPVRRQAHIPITVSMTGTQPLHDLNSLPPCHCRLTDVWLSDQTGKQTVGSPNGQAAAVNNVPLKYHTYAKCFCLPLTVFPSQRWCL